MGKKVRHFIYADSQLIFSIYNQLDGDITSFSMSITNETQKGINAKVEVPNILQGFLDANLSGEYSRDRSKSLTVNTDISIEEKIELITTSVEGNEFEAINKWNNNNRLILGRGKVLKYEFFLSKIKEPLKDFGYSDFEVFLNENHMKQDFNLIWNKLVSNIDLTTQITNGFLFCEYSTLMLSDEINTFIIIDNKFPVFINFSGSKVLLSASSMVNSNLFVRTKEVSVLGQMYENGCNIFTIKPLAMWDIIDLERWGKSAAGQLTNFNKF